jgi:hypothetical protein
MLREKPTPSGETTMTTSSRRSTAFQFLAVALFVAVWCLALVCVASLPITDGVWYWPDVDPNAGRVDLCEACYPRVMKLLAVEANTGADAEGEP